MSDDAPAAGPADPESTPAEGAGVPEPEPGPASGPAPGPAHGPGSAPAVAPEPAADPWPAPGPAPAYGPAPGQRPTPGHDPAHAFRPEPAFGPAPAFAGAPARGPAPGYALGARPGTWPPPAARVPAAAIPRQPGPLARSVTEFWRAGHALSPGALAAGAAVGVLGGVLLVGYRAGLGAALVGLVVWAPALPALVRRRAVGDLLTAALSVALVAMVAVRDAGWIVGVCVAAAAVLAAVAATSARSAGAVLGSVTGWFAGLFRALPWVGRSVQGVAHRGRVAALARTAAVTAALLVAFGLLFSSADLVFASYLPDVHLDLLPGQLVVGVAVGLAAVTLAHLAATPPGWADLRAAPGRPAPVSEWLVPVVALDAMVLAFVLVQVGGLLGGHRHILEAADLSYAEYARQGFGQLVAATALTLLVVAVAARHAPRTTPPERLVTRLALGVLCVGTLGVVASALRRMDLYVEAFGLTRLRLFVVVAEVTLGVVLLLVLVAGVRWRGAWLPRAIAQVCGIAVLGLALANPDALILRHNTTVLATVLAGEDADADAAEAADLDYLQGLSADAVPAAAALDEPLRSCVLLGMDVAEPEGLVDWNLGRARAATELDRLRVDAGLDGGRDGRPIDPSRLYCGPATGDR